MKKLCLLSICFLALPVLADNKHGFYVGVGGASLKQTKDEAGEDISARAVEFLGGYKYNGALGVELRIGQGGSAGTADTTYVGSDGAAQKRKLEYEIGSYTSLYYKPELVNDEAKLYALLGYTQISTTLKSSDSANSAASSKDVSASGYSYGIGVGFVINEHFNINFEYKNVCEELSNRPNLTSINIDYRF